MEQAILKTIHFFDLLDYPLKAWEIQKWLVGKKGNLAEVEKALRSLLAKKKIYSKIGFYFFKKREALVSRRTKRTRYADNLIKKSFFVGKILKVVPWIMLVGVGGSLARLATAKKDKINFIVLVKKGRVGISLLMINILLAVFGLKNIVTLDKILDEESLIQEENIFNAHEILQMKVVWVRGRSYGDFLGGNAWVFEYFPNWIGSFDGLSVPVKKLKKKGKSSRVGDQLEVLANKILEKRKKEEKIKGKLTYPNFFLHEYQKRLRRYHLT